MLKRILSGDQSGAGWGDLQGFPLNRQAKVGTKSGNKTLTEEKQPPKSSCNILILLVPGTGFEPVQGWPPEGF